MPFPATRPASSVCEGAQPLFEPRQQLAADFLERLGNALLQALLQLLRVDAVVDQLRENLVESFGDAGRFERQLRGALPRAAEPRTGRARGGARA